MATDTPTLAVTFVVRVIARIASRWEEILWLKYKWDGRERLRRFPGQVERSV